MNTRALMICAGAYLVALGVAAATAVAISGESPIAVAFWADVAATIAIFGFSLAYRNSSFYDAYWSVAPIPIALFWAFSSEAAGATAGRQLLVIALVTAWGCRLTWNWARGWEGLSHEDWRYVDKRRQTGRLYWPVSFLGLHMVPTLLVFAGCLPLHPALTSDRPLGLLDLAATIVTAGAIWLEGAADNQLRRFRLAKPPAGAILESGLWARCRHPNYLGEILFWWGLFGFALAADPTAWEFGAGAIAITLLFRFISLPLIDTHMLERRPDYKRRLETTPALIPKLF